MEPIMCYLIEMKDLQDEKVYQRSIRALPSIGLWGERLNKIHRYYKLEDKMRSIGAGLLLKNIFDMNGIAYKDLRENQYGKPYIPFSQVVRFNISHSGDYVICTVGNCESGVDIEQNRDHLEISCRFFAKKEYQRIQQDDMKGIKNMFTRMWTLKEAYIKEQGLGLSMELSSFEVCPGRISDEQNEDELVALSLINNTRVTNDRECQFQEFKLGDYSISICSRAMISNTIVKLNTSQLIKD